ncbi:MAG: hypothetical protein NTZ60_10570 [Campylobacterales bacterium]|nr:hypothetical protein [Campylobacterales bacterium]
MKPLLATELKKFLQRFDNFRDGEIRSIDVMTSTTIIMTLVGQDSARGFDWISIKLEFNSVSDARVIENSKLGLIDMSNGVSIINDDNLFAFGIDECYNISSARNSTCFIVCSDIKFKEGAF